MKTQEITIEESREMSRVNIIAFNSERGDRSYSLSTDNLVKAIESYIEAEFNGGSIEFKTTTPKNFYDLARNVDAMGASNKVVAIGNPRDFYNSDIKDIDYSKCRLFETSWSDFDNRTYLNNTRDGITISWLSEEEFKDVESLMNREIKL